MKKKKLTQLQVKSFVTNDTLAMAQKIKGGLGTRVMCSSDEPGPCTVRTCLGENTI